MAAPFRSEPPFLLVLLRYAPPPQPRRQDPAPPPFPREGPGIGAAPKGLRPDSRALTPGAPYKGMVGTEREAGVGAPPPGAASRLVSAERRPSAESPQLGGFSLPPAALESDKTARVGQTSSVHGALFHHWCLLRNTGPHSPDHPSSIIHPSITHHPSSI
ncbi:atherin-like isoform X2 [Sus scrofa]|uniref:atherin-like isoform X2 n=1 Tax=Sus scrofa TaxID=9823 RepID=UPI0006B23905|nr:atherin-like isoform X2 [Sus scrofa]